MSGPMVKMPSVSTESSANALQVRPVARSTGYCTRTTDDAVNAAPAIAAQAISGAAWASLGACQRHDPAEAGGVDHGEHRQHAAAGGVDDPRVATGAAMPVPSASMPAAAPATANEPVSSGGAARWRGR